MSLWPYWLKHIGISLFFLNSLPPSAFWLVSQLLTEYGNVDMKTITRPSCTSSSELAFVFVLGFVSFFPVVYVVFAIPLPCSHSETNSVGAQCNWGRALWGSLGDCIYIGTMLGLEGLGLKHGTYRCPCGHIGSSTLASHCSF